MNGNARLLAKIDEAHRALKAERRRGSPHGSDLATQLRERFARGRPFEVVIGGIAERIDCAKVLVSKTTVVLPTERCDGTIPLTRVTLCRHGQDDEGADVMGFGLVEHDGSTTTLSFA